jgi:hypothetical protein
MQKFLNLTGTANITAGILLSAFWYLYALLLPYQELENTLAILVTDRHWVMVNVLGVLGSLAGLVGLVGIYIKVTEETGSAGLIGFILAFLGTMLFTATLLWDTIIWPILARYDPTLLDFQGPIYTSKTFFPFFIFAGIIYSLGYMIFAITLAKSGVYPYWGCMMIAVGAPLFGLGSMFGKLQVYPRTIGITLLCIGLIWFGRLLRST